MDNELLSTFCHQDRKDMCAPFSFGDCSYATNGHIILRVPRLADVPEWDAINEKAAKLFSDVDLDIALIDIPDFPQPKQEPCIACEGTGKVSKCPECDGGGYVNLENDHNEYECMCKTCDGEGSKAGGDRVCSNCCGTGKYSGRHKPIDVGCSSFADVYLMLLKELPGIKIAPIKPKGLAYFRWDEGDGLIMQLVK